MERKQELRNFFKQKRNGILPEIRDAKSRQITRLLQADEWYREADVFLIYAAIQSEVSLDMFCDMAWKDGKTIYLPKVDGQEMDFYCISDRKQLIKGTFSVMEPNITDYDLRKYDGQKKDIMLLPGVAFSREGNRIGYGAGYYDRYLKRHTNLYTVGICFSEQLADNFKPEENDYPMDEIVTETEYIRRKMI